jgi:hypothetical protein
MLIAGRLNCLFVGGESDLVDLGGVVWRGLHNYHQAVRGAPDGGT